MNTAYFSIIQYVPNLFRRERMNIGVIVTLPTQNALIHGFRVNKRRMECAFPSFSMSEAETFDEYLQAFRDRESINIFDQEEGNWVEYPVASRESLMELSRMYATSTFQFSQIATVDFDEDYKGEIYLNNYLEYLLDRYVALKPKKKKTKQNEHRFLTVVAGDLQNRDLLGDDISEGKVVKSAKIVEKFDWTYDLALKNGATHVFETLDLTTKDISQSIAIQKSGVKYMKLSEAGIYFKEEGNRPFKAYILYNAKSADEKRFALEIETLQRFGTTINYADPEGKTEFIDIIEKAMGRNKMF